MRKISYTTAAKTLGLMLTLASLYYLGQSLFQYSEDVLSVLNQPAFMAIFVIGVIIYALTFLIVVISWYIQLHQKCPHLRFAELFKIVGISQIAKYLPGNVFHIASRFYMAKKRDIKASVITSSLIFETILIIISALLVGSIFFFLHSFPIINIEINYIYWSLFLFISTLVMLYYLNKKENVLELISGYRIVSILTLFVGSHFLLGTIVFIENHLLFSGDSSLFVLTSMLALSFVVGYVTPGSPGGIGIREFVFVKLAVAELDEGVALSLILSLRLISVCGDLLIYLIALKFNRRPGI